MCRVSAQGEVKEYSKYEILENIEGSARLTWVRWDKFSPVVPAGAVLGGKDLIIARRTFRENGESPGLTHFLGTLDKSEGFGKISIINQVKS